MSGAAGRPAAGFLAARAELGEHDTAVIGVDLDALDTQLERLRAAFPTSVRHTVAIKTMPHPGMLRYLVGEGFGLEAASLEEVQLALDAGASPANVIFDSPVKTRLEIDWCQRHLEGGLLNANSLDELARYPADPRFQVGLRINPEIDTGAPSRYDVSGRRSKFGVPISTEPSTIIEACRQAGVTALHMHIGSQVPDARAHVEAVGRLLDLANRIESITTLDIGGGIRAEPFEDERSSTTVMQSYGERLQSEHPALFDFDVRTEFGQWVHAPAGWAASRVESVEDRSVPMAFLHLGADFFMRNVYADGSAESHDIAVVRADGTVADGGPSRTYDLVGPLCFAGDVLARDVALPELVEGDWVVFADTGANTFGLWSRHCSRTIPKVVATRRGTSVRWSDRVAAHGTLT